MALEGVAALPNPPVEFLSPASAGGARADTEDVRRSLTSWRTLPLVARVYVAAVVVAGAVAIIRSIPQIAPNDARFVVALAMLSLIASSAKVRLPLTRGDSTMPLCNVIDFATLLLFGPAPATLTAATGAWSRCAF